MHATNKPFNIEKRLVYEAYKAAKFNRGVAGVDEQTIEQFEADLSSNRMSSGTYFHRHKIQTRQFLQRLATECVHLFVHWQIGMAGVFA